MYLTAAPRILSWGGDTREAEQVHERYAELVSGAASALLVQLAEADADSGHRLAAAVGEAGPRAVEVFLTPEATYRLLWPRRHDVLESADVLIEFLTGDCLPWEYQPVAGLAVDFQSPYALHVDIEGTNARRDTPEEPLSPIEQRDVRGKVEAAMYGVAGTSREVDWFVRRFTKALVVLRDPAAPDKFSSGSSGQFVGRSTLGNAHLAKVTPAKMAEAIVHEAIHSYLYMGEQRERWLIDPELYTAGDRVLSPWTGSTLHLRPFLQACFVWYGLLSFWSIAAGTNLFPLSEVRERLAQAAIGFLRESLLDLVGDLTGRLAPELCDAIEVMQDDVTMMFESDTPSQPVARTVD